MSEFVQKSKDGEYTLTPAGDKHIYQVSTQKLFRYYLIKSLNKSNEEASAAVQRITPYLKENFNSLEDYLDRVADIARFAGTPNADQFEKFMSRHFISTIEKEKTALLQKETSTTRLSYDNQEWLPSQKLIKLYADIFKKAAPLDFSRSTPAPAGETADEWQQQEEEKEQKPVVAPRALPPDKSTLPGLLVLKTFKEQFRNLPPLDLKMIKYLDSPDQPEPAAEVQPETPAPRQTENRSVLPGRICIDKFGPYFHQAPPLPRHIRPAAVQNGAARKELIHLKNVAAILNKIKLFTRTNDHDGYKKWYLGLSVQAKAALKINTLVTKEMKNEAVIWEQNLKELSRSLQLGLDTLEQIAHEIKIHRNTLRIIQSSLAGARERFDLSPAEISAVYNQLVSALDDKTTGQFDIALKFMLKGVSSEEARNYLFEKFSKLTS